MLAYMKSVPHITPTEFELKIPPPEDQAAPDEAAKDHKQGAGELRGQPTGGQVRGPTGSRVQEVVRKESDGVQEVSAGLHSGLEM